MNTWIKLGVFAFCILPLVNCAQSQTKLATPSPFSASFKDKAVEALQNAEMVDPDANDQAYTLAQLEARRTANAITRLATSDAEKQVALKINVYLERTETCRLIGQFSIGTQFVDCLKNAASARDEAYVLLSVRRQGVFRHHSE